jgi:hypothetical protein
MLALALASVLSAGLPDDRLAIITTSDRVQAQRLTGEFDSDPKSRRKGIERWVTQGPLVDVPKPLADRARKLVVEPKTYDVGTRCEFSPGVLLRFFKGEEHADVLFCFHCGDASFAKPEAEWPKEVMGFAAPHDYERARIGFAPGYDALLKLMREIFPKDTALKKVGKLGRDEFKE